MAAKGPVRALAAAAAAALTLAACSSGGGGGDAADANSNAPVGNVKLSADQLRRIHLFTVAPVAYHRTIAAPGTVDFDNDQATSVLSPFTGPVVRVLVALGQRVAKGQPLALVKSGDYAAAVDAYRKAMVTAANARRVADADKDLAAHNGISAREAAQAQTDAAGAEADRDAARQALVALNGAGRASSGAAIIRAPIAGTIVDKEVTPGQLLQAGSTQTFTVANLSRVWVLAQVSNSDLGAIRAGDSATIDAGTAAGSFLGRVDNVAASVDPNSRAVVARITLANPNGFLRKQMYVDVSIQSDKVSTGLLVPVSAVLRDDENLPFVYIALPDGSFARRHVSLGYRDSTRYEIVDGLKPGDRIVVDGAIFLQFMQNQ
ncbi:MAG TPA: efflux RND transporter periplasmic adaptor subunit [Allosphingosinicella sp.]|nr:efflux RND transporter periplasmic adaptor subunit [Allosphingosinicella sp.]